MTAFAVSGDVIALAELLVRLHVEPHGNEKQLDEGRDDEEHHEDERRDREWVAHDADIVSLSPNTLPAGSRHDSGAGAGFRS